jgi:AcrR family transcriptional regulator
MAAILDGATSLFAARGPAAVSVRDIAAEAGVNHGLVHRHFGSKQAVLRAVFERAAREMAAVAADMTDPQEGMARLFAASAEHETYWRALARAILDGENPHTLQREFPTIQTLIRLLEEEHVRAHNNSTAPPFDARAVVGTLSALMLGWLMFEPYLLTAIGCEQRDQRGMRQQVVQVLQQIIGLARSRSAC